MNGIKETKSIQENSLKQMDDYKIRLQQMKKEFGSAFGLPQKR